MGAYILANFKGVRWASSMLRDDAFSERGKSGNVLGCCSGITKRNRKQ